MRDPGLPTFFSTSFVVPSGRVNSTAVISPSLSLPVHLRVSERGAVPEVGLRVRSVHSGVVFPCDVGVGVLVIVPVGVFAMVPVGVLDAIVKATYTRYLPPLV